ncbi:hypothetical protein PILCRDRAFT_103 [Piloderma croceum F 1598]|uniref:Uncharacterized protein n=1 Tax=Piloderma croceum (strain F 1598) TaxID=765440 RepID=A0A0C3CQK7_PILCF|nr:hypothetical protein PILCRDRAFT_103 [Piloderma croceum F 1598]
MTGHSPLFRLCQDTYSSIKAQYPKDGRRKWKLRVAEQFWKLDPESKAVLNIGVDPISWANADFVTDVDPWDESTSNIPEIGILVRTDYTNEDAWQTVYAKLKEAEKEFASDDISEADKMVEDEPARGTQNQVSPADAMQEDDSSSSDEDDEGIGLIFKIINPQSSESRAQFTSISNLAALRLFNDMDIRLAPTPPAGTQRIKPPNRLVDFHGWQEVYSGKSLWIYDVTSNEDQCVRIVGQSGDMYGTATGDSWRARVSHICELQVNLHGGMKIDFGGLDRWDYGERQRNMHEANLPIT